MRSAIGSRTMPKWQCFQAYSLGFIARSTPYQFLNTPYESSTMNNALGIQLALLSAK